MNSASEDEDETWTQDIIEGDTTDDDDCGAGQQRSIQLPNGQKFECNVVVRATNLTADNRHVGVACTESGDVIWFDGKTGNALTGNECNELRAHLCETEEVGHKVTPAAVCKLSDITEPTSTDYLLHNELEYTSCTELMAYDEQQKSSDEERATKKPKVAAVQKSAAKKSKETKAKADSKKGKKPAARKKADGATDPVKTSAPKAALKRKAEPAAAQTTTSAPKAVAKRKAEPAAVQTTTSASKTEPATTAAKPVAKRKAATSKAASASKRGKMTWRVEITGDSADDISHFFANAAKTFTA